MRTETLRNIETRFTWGKVRQIHRIGPYLIVEYKPNKPSNAEPGWRPEVSFHPYQKEGRRWYDMHHSFGSLDTALVACVAWAHEVENHGWSAAANSRAVTYFMRMIGPETVEI